MFKFRSICLSLVVAAAALGSATATAADRRVEVPNKTGVTLVGFYASRVNVADWEENILAGGFSSAVLELLNANGLKNKVLCLGLPDAYIQHGPAKLLRERVGLCASGVLAALRAFHP